MQLYGCSIFTPEKFVECFEQGFGRRLGFADFLRELSKFSVKMFLYNYCVMINPQKQCYGTYLGN